MKKKIALLLALVLTFMMAVTSYAAETVPSSNDTATITVYNVGSGATVTAYQIISAEYNSYGLTGYVLEDGVTIADMESPTSDEITAIADAINNGTLSLTSVTLTENSDGTYTANVGAGMWIILVTDSSEDVYNPMIVSVDYTDANDADSISAGSVDADGTFTLGSDYYAKKTGTDIDKVIVTDGGDVNGASFDIGDEVTFKITVTMPDYSEAYEDIVFEITDTMSEGLDAVDAEDITVTVGENEVSAGDDTYTVSTDGLSFTISFAESYILANGGSSVVITYTTTINSAAVLAESVSQNTNEAEIKFTNDYGTTTTKKDKVYVYSFKITDELVKMTSNGSISTDGTDVTVTNALEGATFTIYTDEACSQVYTNDLTEGSYTTNDDGYITFSGLAAGTYYIKETEAPEGYYLIDTVYTVTISETYNEDGTLQSYTITVSSDSGSGTSTYTFSYGDTGTITISASETPVGIVNTKLSNLPSTGDIGAGIFVLLSVAILLLAILGISQKRKMKA